MIAIGLSMDAFAVAVCKGLAMKRFNVNKALLCALFFGAFQGLMPVIGYFVGSAFEVYINKYDHWIAFVLLVFIGIHMVYEALHEDEDDVNDSFSLKELTVLAIATSIDALIIGVSFAALPNVNIAFSASTIALITFTLSAVGVAIGNKFGSRFKSKAEIAGGVILVCIGTKVLIEHLFFS